MTKIIVFALAGGIRDATGAGNRGVPAMNDWLLIAGIVEAQIDRRKQRRRNEF